MQDFQEPLASAAAPHKPDLQKILRPVEVSDDDLLPHKNRKPFRLNTKHQKHIRIMRSGCHSAAPL